MQKIPMIGVGVLILNDKNEVLLGLRNSSHGAGEWFALENLPDNLFEPSEVALANLKAGRIYQPAR